MVSPLIYFCFFCFHELEAEFLEQDGPGNLKKGLFQNTILQTASSLLSLTAHHLRGVFLARSGLAGEVERGDELRAVEDPCGLPCGSLLRFHFARAPLPAGQTITKKAEQTSKATGVSARA